MGQQGHFLPRLELGTKTVDFVGVLILWMDFQPQISCSSGIHAQHCETRRHAAFECWDPGR